jgi:hypothetical protein
MTKCILVILVICPSPGPMGALVLRGSKQLAAVQQQRGGMPQGLMPTAAQAFARNPQAAAGLPAGFQGMQAAGRVNPAVFLSGAAHQVTR